MPDLRRARCADGSDEAESYEETVRSLERAVAEERLEAERATGRVAAVAEIVVDALQFAAAVRRELQDE